ncbi:MAG: hypothetical protein M1813_007783 [Trichoglossum hirsutum]|nr:MAG: hypothetical protein M1813_007783 [Trichoglossum hirsutum]
MANNDLKAHATSSHDFYALLSITPETPQSEIRRAYRKTALKYHPDKHPNNPSAIETFHLLQIAYDVLSDPAIKVLYDNARIARAAKARQSQLLDGERRRMKEDLERREKGFFGGVKRKWDEEDTEEKLEREIRRLQADGARRRKEMEEMLRREKLEEEKAYLSPEEANMSGAETYTGGPGGTNVPEIDRTVKVRWSRESTLGSTLTKDALTSLFAKFGDIENVFLLRDKKLRVGGKRKKLMATGVVEYRSIVSAHAAVEDVKKQTGELWAVVESVCWAGNKEPESVGVASPPINTTSNLPPSTPSTPSRPAPRFPFAIPTSTPISTAKPQPTTTTATNDANLKRVPSFASFTSVGSFSTPKGSPFSKDGTGTRSPSLEEVTLIRLRNAERKRLEEEIRRNEEEEEVVRGGD